ncbi:MAG: FkbM family methyltransferase [Actinomycetota bacterium]|nr:FkbM family methyltransferase [Actinomycetota bacterium]
MPESALTSRTGPANAPTRLRLARALAGRLQPFGAGKVGRLLYPYECGKRDRFDFAARAKTGSTFAGSTADFHAHPFAISGYSEWRNWAVALALCRSGDVIVEVGANVGTETIGFSDIVGSDGRVVAFEPLPAHLTALEAMLGGLRQANVTLLPYALSDRVGIDTFAVPPPSMSQGIGHLLGPAERASGTTTYYDSPVEMTVIEVQSRPLDKFATEVRGMRLLVTDAEGAEILILRGGRRVLGAERPALLLEASQPHQRRAGFDIAELYNELRALGYTAYVINKLSLKKVENPRAGATHSNWLCLPQDSLQLIGRVQRYVRRCALMPCVLGLNPLTQPRRR